MPITPIQPAPNLGSQLDRALIAYLWEIWPVVDDGPNVTNPFPRPNFYFANDNEKRVVADSGLIDISSHDATEFTPHTRNEEWTTRLEARWPGANQPGDADSKWPHTRINNFIGTVMAALSQTDADGDGFRATYRAITAAGRRLAIFGSPDIANALPSDIENNADMAEFSCDYLQYRGAQRMTVGEGGFNYGEVRSYIFRVGNFYDNSSYPRLSYSGGSLAWTYTGNFDPHGWIIEKSTDGITWLTHATVSGDQRTANIATSGTNYWRIFPQDSDGNQNTGLMAGESNTIHVEGA